MPGDEYWNTDNEKHVYIDSLVAGTYRENPQLTAEERLINYIRSAKRRMRWKTFGSVDGEEVVRYAEEQLMRLRGE
jgi:hypothetical protein